MFPRRTTLLFLALTLAGHPLRALTLDEFAGDTALWTDKGRIRLNELLGQGGYQWTSVACDTLRSPRGGAIAGQKAGETLVRLNGKLGTPVALEVSLFNRGDDGDVDEKEFEKRVLDIHKAISTATGVKPVVTKRSRLSAVRAAAAIWAAPGATWYLEWSKNRDNRRPEFIRLELRPASAAKELIRDMGETGANPAKKYTPADHLETTPAGEKWIKDVPMVDQGSKGYCVVASTERVLKLYGLPTDEHELAQLAESDAAEGTRVDKLVEAFRKNSARLRVRTQVLQDWDVAFFEGFVNDYNAAARKARKPPAPSPRRDMAAFNAALHDLLKSPLRVPARKANASGVRQFERTVATTVDKGWPILWSVTLGLVPEVPAIPQSDGGHLRLIIGYNAAKHTIIYSDSWGGGHERKEMAAADAFAITDMMVALIP